MSTQSELDERLRQYDDSDRSVIEDLIALRERASTPREDAVLRIAIFCVMAMYDRRYVRDGDGRWMKIPARGVAA